MPDTPSLREREWLLDRLAELIRVAGHERFVTAPILEDDARDFPDPRPAGAAGVQVIARRLLWHAGLPEVRARVRDLRGPQRPEAGVLTATDVWFAELADGVAEFELAALGNDDGVGILCHEVGQAFRAHHADALGGHPFRSVAAAIVDTDTAASDASDDDAVATDDDAGSGARGDTDWARALGSLAAVYLGFGVLATNASHSARHAGEVIGGTVHTLEWAHGMAGGLPSQAMSFLCAVQAVARSDDVPYKALSDNQRADFRAWVAALTGERKALLERLGIPAQDRWLPAQRVVEPFTDERYDDADALTDDERARFNAGQIVFRVHVEQRRYAAAVAVGVAVGIVAGLASVPQIGLVAGLLVFALVMTVTPTQRADHCSDLSCMARLTEDDAVCPRCGGEVAGEIARMDDRLEAEEAVWAERQGSASPDEDEDEDEDE